MWYNDIEKTMRPYKWECYNRHENFVRGIGFSSFDKCEECERMKLKNREDNERKILLEIIKIMILIISAFLFWEIKKIMIVVIYANISLKY